MAESLPPADAKAARMKSLANIITTLTALIIAVGALFKPTDNTITKTGYNELAGGVKLLSDGMSKNHDDIVALRNYIDGYVKAQDQRQDQIITAVASAAVPSGPPTIGSTGRLQAGSRPAPPPLPAASSTPPPPAAAPKMPEAHPPAFDTIVKKAD